MSMPPNELAQMQQKLRETIPRVPPMQAAVSPLVEQGPLNGMRLDVLAICEPGAVGPGGHSYGQLGMQQQGDWQVFYMGQFHLILCYCNAGGGSQVHYQGNQFDFFLC